MDEEEKYSQDWEKSSKYFYDKGYYNQMCHAIEEYKTVVEIGCGTGYSTLALVENGHRIIVIEKNHFCIEKSKALLQSKGFYNQVQFIEGDIVTDEMINKIFSDYQFDIVVCWNVGTCYTKETFLSYLPYMMIYGLTIEQIQDAPESSYSELILWDACRIASDKEVPVHIIERSKQDFSESNYEYYKELGDEFGYSNMAIESFKGDSLSSDGRMLSCNGIPYYEEKTEVTFLSILLKYGS